MIVGETEPSDHKKCVSDECSFLNTLTDEPETTQVKVKDTSSTASLDASQKCTKEKHGTLDKRNSALGGIPEDMKLLDGYCSVASKRKLANEISYSESKKVKGHENKVVVENLSHLVEDICNQIRTSQSYSMSIFTRRQLEVVENRFRKSSPNCNTFKENSTDDSSKERLMDSQRDDSLSSTFSRQSNKDQRMHKQFNDLESGSSELGKKNNPTNERHARHKRERADRDRKN